jgi:AcrR family transcriptional regulator
VPSQAATDRILETASKLFYKKGIRATGVDGIAADSGLTKMTLYACFGSKEELVRAYLARRDQRWRDWFKGAVERDPHRDPAQRPLAIFDALGERFADPEFRGCAFINAMAELGDRDHPGYLAALEHKTRVQDYVRGLLKDSGYRDTGALAKRFMLLIDGAMVTAYREQSPAAARHAREIAAGVISGWPRSTVD